ncbi:MAG: 2-oxoacid:ferredoxin oxidoreductase subunit beta [Acidobacteria bacterium]|nr:2-oxoacid:ferredoxin oxidoreductase subunit beta [Acidobacteriota bacterium]
MATGTDKKLQENRIGLTIADYKGGKSTLCGGCGHDVITNAIIRAFHEMGVEPGRVAKLSGIGCSSKTPTYFIDRAHGFNGVHGRMPAMATGAAVANCDLRVIGISGDGDTASIGMGQFVHLLRRNVPMIYIVENNGVYGLTKGQFSATADLGSKLKTGIVNELPPVDLCGLAIELGASFVARSFAGDVKQLVGILEAAIAHRGTALLDVISPCVTFNNHPGSTKSYDYAKDHEAPVHQIEFVPFFDHPMVEQEPGQVREVQMYDGSVVRFRPVEEDYDPRDRHGAWHHLKEAAVRSEILTGILYVDERKPDFLKLLDLGPEPLVHVGADKLRPPRSALDAVNASLMEG